MSVKEHTLTQAVYGRGRFSPCGREPNTWRECVYKDVLGYVHIYTQQEAGGGEYWQFSAIVNRREHILGQQRTAASPLSERGAKIIAGRWLRGLHCSTEETK